MMPSSIRRSQEARLYFGWGLVVMERNMIISMWARRVDFIRALQGYPIKEISSELLHPITFSNLHLLHPSQPPSQPLPSSSSSDSQEHPSSFVPTYLLRHSLFSAIPELLVATLNFCFPFTLHSLPLRLSLSLPHSLNMRLIPSAVLFTATALAVNALPHLAEGWEHRSLAGLSAETIEYITSRQSIVGASPAPAAQSDTSSKLVFDSACPFIAPRSSDVQGPCPGLNTLAVQAGYNIDQTLGVFLAWGDHLSSSAGSHPPSPVQVGGLNTHASPTRGDAYFGDNFDFQDSGVVESNGNATESSSSTKAEALLTTDGKPAALDRALDDVVMSSPSAAASVAGSLCGGGGAGMKEKRCQWGTYSKRNPISTGAVAGQSSDTRAN
ncbi:hypothetical protein V8E36_003144 [Tilletia maclaganii]